MNPHVNENTIVSNGTDVVEVIPSERKRERTSATMFFESIVDEVKTVFTERPAKDDGQVNDLLLGHTGYIDQEVPANTYGQDSYGRKFVTFYLTNEDGKEAKFNLFERYVTENSPIVTGRWERGINHAPFGGGAMDKDTLISLLELVANKQSCSPKEWVRFPHLDGHAVSDTAWRLTNPINK